MTISEKRAAPRSTFPSSARPTLTLEGLPLAVLDISQKGLCFAAPRRFSGRVGERFSAMLKFRGGPVRPVSGRIVRTNRKCVAVRFETEVKFDQIATGELQRERGIHGK